MLVVISQTLCFWLIIQLLVIIKSAHKICSLTHRKSWGKPNIWILPPLLEKNKCGRSQLHRDQIFSHTICLYNRKFDWYLMVDPIWSVWHTYISHWSTDPLTDSPAHSYRSFSLSRNKKYIENRSMEINKEAISPSFRSVRFPKPQIFVEMFPRNLQSSVWSRHVGAQLLCANMAAGK